MAADQELFDAWFRFADADRDNVIGGADAVSFFSRSGLPQETLFKIWQAVAGDAPTLSRAQFYSSLRLIALAQKRGGVLPEEDARKALLGLGPPLPPPAMTGLDALVGAPAGARDTWRPSYPGAAAAQPQRAPPPPPTGTTTGSAAAAATAWPPLPRASAAAYRAEFARLDADGDGLVSGADAAPALAASGATRDALRACWACVAGDAGELDVEQFVAARYLSDLAAKSGRAPPASLPPGAFPPEEEEETWEAARQGTAAWEAFSPDEEGPARLPRVPPLPAKERGEFPTSQQRASALPPLPAVLEGDDDETSEETTRLREERRAAAEADAALAAAETAAARAAAREKAFTQALSELKIFQARVSAATLQAQQRAEADRQEADEAEEKYKRAWDAASAEHARATEALDALTKEKARKLEASTKLDELKRDVERLSEISPQDAEVEREEATRLLAEVAALEAKRERLAQQEAKRKKGIRAKAAKVEALKAAVAEAERVVSSGAGAGGADGDEKKSGIDAEEVKKVAVALATAAAAAGVPLSSSTKGSSSPLEFDALAAANASDWDDWEDSGYDVVDALAPVQSEDENDDEGEVEEEEAEAEASGGSSNDGGSETTTAVAPPPAPVEDYKETSSPMEKEETALAKAAPAAEEEAPTAGWASF